MFQVGYLYIVNYLSLHLAFASVLRYDFSLPILRIYPENRLCVSTSPSKKVAQKFSGQLLND